MTDPGPHCPFLNRSDSRCAQNFSLGRLSHALRHCVGNYMACATYLELLVERRVKRQQAAERNWQDGKGIVQISIHGQAAGGGSRAAAAGASTVASAPGR